MQNFEEREVKLQPTCLTCEHRCALGYIEEEDCFYCMLGVSKEDEDHVKEIEFDGKEYDDRFREIMKLKSDTDRREDSPRLIKLNNVCQFYKPEE